MTTVDATTTAGFSFVQDQPTTGTCSWTASAAGLYQASNAWGNYPNYNTLTGCNALVEARSFTDFIMEVEVDAVADNDGYGLVFGWNSETDNVRAILMNDGSPNPAADGVGGPFMKIKAANGNACLGSMDPSNNCFDTLSFLTNGQQDSLRSQAYNDASWGPTNFNHASGLNSWPHALPAPFAQE